MGGFKEDDLGSSKLHVCLYVCMPRCFMSITAVHDETCMHLQVHGWRRHSNDSFEQLRNGFPLARLRHRLHGLPGRRTVVNTKIAQNCRKKIEVIRDTTIKTVDNHDGMPAEESVITTTSTR